MNDHLTGEDEGLREQAVAALMHRWGVEDTDEDAYDAACADFDLIVPLVAKAQREADVAALEANAASRRYGGQIPQWAADYLRSLPLISEEATRGD